MASRQVKQTGKNDDDITALCGDWGRASKQQAIQDIEGGTHNYWVQVPGTDKVDVVVMPADANRGKYLRTDPDKTPSNNLDNLPDC